MLLPDIGSEDNDPLVERGGSRSWDTSRNRDLTLPSPTSSAVSLDQFDLKILAHLEREGRCSNIELADAIGLSQSPCLVRTKRLQQAGVIRGYRADIALEKLGRHVVVFSEVTISSHRPHDLRKFEAVVGQHHEIVEWYNVSGRCDYLLKIVAPSVACFQDLMERLLQDDIGIEKFMSRIVLRQSSDKRSYPLHLIAAQRNRA